MTLRKNIRKCTDPVGYSIAAEEMIHSPGKNFCASERNGTTQSHYYKLGLFGMLKLATAYFSTAYANFSMLK